VNPLPGATSKFDTAASSYLLQPPFQFPALPGGVETCPRVGAQRSERVARLCSSTCSTWCSGWAHSEALQSELTCALRVTLVGVRDLQCKLRTCRQSVFLKHLCAAATAGLCETGITAQWLPLWLVVGTSVLAAMVRRRSSDGAVHLTQCGCHSLSAHVLGSSDESRHM
jgi:hypothetical protein